MFKGLEGCEPGDGRFDTLITQLKASVTEHVADEEYRLFSLLADACSADALQELGEKVRSKLLAPGTGMVDRLRDALTGRGRQH